MAWKGRNGFDICSVKRKIGKKKDRKGMKIIRWEEYDEEEEKRREIRRGGKTRETIGRRVERCGLV